jgi:uncharacterized protein
MTYRNGFVLSSTLCALVRALANLDSAITTCIWRSAFASNSDYNGTNFLWFRRRCERFIYIDRVAVTEEARGRGLARALYADLFARASADGHDTFACEVSISPPNPISSALHKSLGFREVGRADISNDRSVSYLALRL